jgi:shikimate kinase
VWLRADPATLAARVGGGPARPLLGDDAEGVLRVMDDERRPLYAEVADLVVDVDRRGAADIAAAIADALTRRSL